MTLASTGLYGSPPVVHAGVVCPNAVGAANCESFALLGSDCVWRTAVASLQGSSLLLTAGSWNASAGAAVGTRAYYANWPIVTVTNQAGVPLLPWAEPARPAPLCAFRLCCAHSSTPSLCARADCSRGGLRRPSLPFPSPPFPFPERCSLLYRCQASLPLR